VKADDSMVISAKFEEEVAHISSTLPMTPPGMKRSWDKADEAAVSQIDIGTSSSNVEMQDN